MIRAAPFLLAALPALAWAQMPPLATDPGQGDWLYCNQVDLVDLDRNGFIDYAEAEAYSQRLFAAWDRDGDGALGRDEFADCMLNSDLFRDAIWAAGNPTQQAHRVFAAWDSDGDGMLTPQEFSTEEVFAGELPALPVQ